jgi:hypothetical protein
MTKGRIEATPAPSARQSNVPRIAEKLQLSPHGRLGRERQRETEKNMKQEEKKGQNCRTTWDEIDTNRLGRINLTSSQTQ